MLIWDSFVNFPPAKNQPAPKKVPSIASEIAKLQSFSFNPPAEGRQPDEGATRAGRASERLQGFGDFETWDLGGLRASMGMRAFDFLAWWFKFRDSELFWESGFGSVLSPAVP